MMIDNLQAFIDERAENLAIVYLTRRPDLSIQRMEANRGLDLFVEILENEKPSGQVFGIQLKATAACSPADMPTDLLKDNSLKYAQNLPFPVCLFLFEMEHDRGFYTWLKAPVSREQSEEQNQDLEEWRSLTPDSLNTLIRQVTAWYQQKQQVAA